MSKYILAADGIGRDAQLCKLIAKDTYAIVGRGDFYELKEIVETLNAVGD